ncbi:MAG: response regulator [Chloroflexota bacterium]|nr:MAG: two-component system response regulator [Anaerolineaceae bacterium 4572_5.2]RLD11334.1 MAG: response regulator [Chloroflexota bacterium]
MKSIPVILCVEDNQRNRTLVKRILEFEGYEVQEAENAHRALEMLKTMTPALILMDINMPEVDGFTLTRQLRKLPQLSNIPIIAITANAMKGDKERTLQAGCDSYIEKPIDVDLLITQVNSYLTPPQN